MTAALERRDAIRARFDALADCHDGMVALAATGAAPVGLGYTGNPGMNVPASLLGVPAISLPLLADEGLPLGVQFVGRRGQDAGLMALAGWRLSAVPAAVH